MKNDEMQKVLALIEKQIISKVENIFLIYKNFIQRYTDAGKDIEQKKLIENCEVSRDL